MLKKYKLNCWEYKCCADTGPHSDFGKCTACPAFNETRLDGINGGKNGGRACWAIAGTMCNNTPQGTYAQKELSCLYCDFFKKVRNEEGVACVSTWTIHDLIGQKRIRT